ncbi:MAG: isopentenyl-diphosphate Delta-isomerase [Candidatus Micrarchaeia archaeon]|jgi:isopentenyl-diphosphate delta-isomerase
MEEVVLVDEKDRQIGTMEKMQAHMNGGKLHRAISIFVFNKKGELMLQQRAFTKYHSKGKWSNTVCTHPRPGESVDDAAHRRLKEEMGFDCPLKEEFSFIYKADVGEGLTEYEFDHVFFGEFDGEPKLNPEEAASYKWAKLEDVANDIKKNPDLYTPWFRIIFDRVMKERGKKGKGSK